MKRRLPVLAAKKEPLTAERLFRDLLLPLYPPGVRLDVVRATDANPANNPAILEAVEETARVFAGLGPEALGVGDLALDFTDASVHRLSGALTAAARDRMFEQRPSAEAPSLLVHFIIHAALYVGACAVRNHGGRWLVRNPLWETRVALTARAGSFEIAPLAWILRSLSDEHMGKVSLADRYRTHVEVPFEDTDRWPILAEPSRRLPRLAKVRYDLLFQHLRRHLPELRDFGADFPEPARFAELGFSWLDFELVGGGRALVMHGPTPKGVHLFWLTQAGFMKAAFFETTDAGGPRASESHRLERAMTPDGTEKLVLTLAGGGTRQSQTDRTVEMLWWGP